MRRLLLLITILALTSAAWAGQHHKERYYQERWCRAHQGKMEAVLPDGSRVDCLTPTHAVEVDFASKWAEAIGQALFYASMTEKQPGIVLIAGPRDNAQVIRLFTVIHRWGLPIDVWVVRRGQ